MEPEDAARQNIDRMLEDSGWVLQDYKDLNLGAGFGMRLESIHSAKKHQTMHCSLREIQLV